MEAEERPDRRWETQILILIRNHGVPGLEGFNHAQRIGWLV